MSSSSSTTMGSLSSSCSFARRALGREPLAAATPLVSPLIRARFVDCACSVSESVSTETARRLGAIAVDVGRGWWLLTERRDDGGTRPNESRGLKINRCKQRRIKRALGAGPLGAALRHTEFPVNYFRESETHTSPSTTTSFTPALTSATTSSKTTTMSAKIDLSLDRIRSLLAQLPAYTRPTCHIAGTNGKGSVSVLLSSILSASSYSVGRFNSPHLIHVHDCITLNNEPVSPQIYQSSRQRIEKADKEHDTRLTSFELLTATALIIFEEAKVDVVVLEVGMGGRLDATNVIPDESVLVSALTAVDLDHQAFLGSTVREIAREKASIARPGKPFVLGPQNPEHAEEVEAVVREAVARVGGELILASTPSARDWASTLDTHPHFPPLLHPSVFPADGPPPFAQPVALTVPGLSDADVVYTLLPLQGEHQLANLGTAVAIVSALTNSPRTELDFKHRITADSVSQGIRTARWPGRLSFHTVRLPTPTTPDARDFLVLADGAHNPASATTLSAFLANLLNTVTRPPAESAPACAVEPRTLTLTYVLALSHSPPKTPRQTLTSLLALPTDAVAPHVRLVTRVALLGFSPPAGMPWVKHEAPEEVRGVMNELLPKAEVWTPGADAGTPGVEQLKAALAWAAEGQLRDGGLPEESEGVIVVAGSLYLVADFYRLLDEMK